YKNQAEGIKEWTNLLGLSATPTSTDSTSTPGYTIQTWQNSCPFTVLEAHTQANGDHGTPIDASAVISFFGLDKSGPDPQVVACTRGTGGAPGGTGGTRGTGGAAGTGGTPGTGGVGSSGSGGARVTGTGGALGTGGRGAGGSSGA